MDNRGWKEPTNIYAVPVLPPATRKSPVYALLRRPIEDWEAERCSKTANARARAKADAQLAAEMYEHARKACARDRVRGRKASDKTLDPDDLEALRIEAQEAADKVKPPPRLLASDATPEALVALMADHDGRIALLEPEADPFGIADGRYSDSPRLDELLRAWSGESIRVDRVGRDPIQVPRPALTLAITAQPAVLEGLRNSRAFRGRGFHGRILWALPKHGLGARLTGSAVPELDQRAVDRYGAMIRALLGSTGCAGGHTLTLTDDALDVLYHYESEVEAELADGARLAGIRDWAGKICGQAIRLAALVEIAARAEEGRPLWSDPIGRWAMDCGVRLARALTTHALRVLTELGTDGRVATQLYVLRRASELCELREPEPTLRNLYERVKGRTGTETMKELRPIVAALQERGCLRLVASPPKGPGNPPSPRIEIHPELRKSIRTIRTNSDGDARHSNSANSANPDPGSATTTLNPPLVDLDNALEGS